MLRILIAAILTWCLATASHAQTDPRRDPEDSSDVLVLDHVFSAHQEVVRVFLQEGQVYRAELSSDDLTLVISGVVRNQQLPRVYPFLKSDTPSGASIFEVYPQKDAQYEIRSLALDGSWVATRLRLYRDVRASRRRQYVRSTRGWATGVEVAGGWHSGFAQSSAPAVSGSEPAGGTDVEGCFTARASGRFGMCVIGLGHQSQRAAKTILWVYTEPRIGLVGGARPGRSSWEFGALVRFGLGLISASPATPVLLGPGLYVARHLATSPSGGDWTIQASYSRSYFKGFTKPLGSVGEVTPQSNRLSLGIGWYR